jgi:hypothetical protein
MACPYFYPEALLQMDYWAVPPRLPLGDAYSGECRAQDAGFRPDEKTARHVCNLGYGRGSCGRLPADASGDAVRFHVAAETPQMLRIQYVLEKDCWPQEHRIFEWSKLSQEISGELPDEILRRQLGAFVESYRRRCAE